MSSLFACERSVGLCRLSVHCSSRRTLLLQNYFNHTSQIADGWWERRDFTKKWRRIYESDRRWVPPYFPHWRRMLEPGNSPHLSRMDPLLLSLEALPDRRPQGQTMGVQRQSWRLGAVFEEPVAAAVVLADVRRRDNTAYLGMLHCANDVGSLEKFLGRIFEILAPQGIRQLIGPTGLSPHLQSGVLQDHFNLDPPLYTPYNPPYLPEVISAVCRPAARSQLYVADVPFVPVSPASGPAMLASLAPARLAGDLLPLLAMAAPAWSGFPAPDADEAAFLMDWLTLWPLHGWLASVAGEPVGFVLLQPDLAVPLRRARGGRNLPWRHWLSWRAQHPVGAGRLVFGGVLPDWRGEGIGHQLWQQTLRTAQQQGWQRLSIGPLPSTAAGINFLVRQGARPLQSYLLHRYEF